MKKSINFVTLKKLTLFILILYILPILSLYSMIPFHSYAESAASISTGGGSTLFTGSQPVIVDPALAITGTNLDGARVTIDNIQYGDILSYTNMYPGIINGSWNGTTGVLTLTGSATVGQYQELLRTVTFSTTSAAVTTRNITFSLGSAVPHTNGHFYEYVSASVSWATAKTLAEGRYYFGMQGYLATITNYAENELIRQKLQADAWIGASDDYNYINSCIDFPYYDQNESEGMWYWVTGPEAGTLFSAGNLSPFQYTYMYWNGSEPNNSGSCEHYGEIYSTGSSGRWNDLPITSTMGYVVEYGGMEGDPVVNISAAKSIIIASHVATVNSGSYTVSPTAPGIGTITSVPFGTGKTAFLSSLSKGQVNQTWNNTGISDPVATGNQLMVTAQDGYTTMAYTVTVNQVYLAEGSLGVAGDSKITGLASSLRYQIRVDGTLKYVRANGTLTDSELEIAQLTGTEITGLVNQKTYKVEPYSPTKVNVSYNALNGSPVQTIQADFNGLLTAPIAPGKVGHTFSGWYTEDTYVSIWDFDVNKVTTPITLYAKWTLNQYTLTYSAGANGSITGTLSQSVSHGASGSTVTAVPTTGYHFVKWSDDILTASRTDTNVTGTKSVTATFEVNQYTLTYSAGPNGSITGTLSQSVNHGESGFTVTAVPAAGYHFVKWSDEILTASRTDTNVTGTKSVTATFAINQYTLTYSAGPNGSITGTLLQTVSHGASGSMVTAVPAIGYHFVKWSDGLESAARTDTNVIENKTLTATFAINVYTLTYSAGANGSITGTLSQSVSHGASGSTVTAVPATGYHFVKWSDDILTASRTDTNVTGTKSVTATFAINQYTLTYSAGPNGSITGTLSQSVSHGTSGSTVTAVPATGYHFVKWSDDILTASRTDTNITETKSVTATFEVNQYTLTYSAGPNGSITGTLSQSVSHGESGSSVTAVPAAGYHFVRWSDDILTASRTDTNITETKSLTATFAINVYVITFDTQGGSAIDSINLDHGSLIPVPDTTTISGMTFDAWYKEAEYNNVWSFATDHVTGNTTLFAKWINLAPTGTIQINAGAASTNTKTVELTFTVTDPEEDAITQMCFSTDGVAWSIWESFISSKLYELPSGDGIRTIMVKFKDAYGNESEIFSDTIMLDTTPPAVTAISDGGAYNTTVVPEYYEGTATISRNGGISSPFASGTAISDEGIYELVITDETGNMSSTSFIIDKTSPSGTLSINNGADYTVTTGVSLTFSISDGPGAGGLQLRFSNDGSTWSPWSTTEAALDWTIGGSYGTNTVFMQLKDRAGNINNSISDTIWYKSVPASYDSIVNGFEDNVISFSASDFSYNNPDGKVLDRIQVITLPGNGVLELNNTVVNLSQEISAADLGGLTFIPDPDWNGTAYLVWKGSDGILYSEQTASIALSVAPVNDAPVACDGILTTNVDESGTGILQAVDIDSNTLTFNVTTPASLGIVVLDAATGAFSYVPNTTGSSFGMDYFTFTVTDGDAVSNIATVNIQIIPSHISDLSLLSANYGTLTPAFAKNTMAYTMNVGYDISQIELTPVAEDSRAVVTVNGNGLAGGSSAVLLNTGFNHVVIEVTAQDGVTKKIYNITINRALPPQEPEQEEQPDTQSGQGQGQQQNNAGSNTHAATGTIGGIELVIGTSAPTDETDGNTVISFTADEYKILDAIEQAGDNALLSIPFTDEADKFIAQLNGLIVKNMENKQDVLEITTESATYTLPAQQINITSVAGLLGEGIPLEDIKVYIELSQPTEEMLRAAEIASKDGESVIVAPPVVFTVNCTYGGRTVEIASFSNYVERTISLPDDADPLKITTGVVIEQDGTLRHVPTKIAVIGGKYFAKINSLTNSMYSVIWHPVEFSDLKGHWAREAVNDMGSRMVITGVDDNRFSPDSNITRADFASIIIKALGLKPVSGQSPFIDVKTSDPSCNYLRIAYEYGLVLGYGNNLYGPQDLITREQAMLILSRAMKITGLDVEFKDGESENLLLQYNDADIAAGYLRGDVAAVIKAGVVTGKDSRFIDPKGSLTRAEAAVMIRRLLQKSGLI